MTSPAPPLTSRPSTSVDALAPLIGATPLLEIHFRYRGAPGRIFAKYELENMTGSVKDRMAAHILRRGYESGELSPGDTIAEASSGNTGISFAALGRATGHPVRIYLPNWMSQERVQLIHNFGAEVVPVSHEQGGFCGAVQMAEEWAEQNENAFLPHQFDSPINIEAHQRTTGPEIEQQLGQYELEADAFLAGVGTGGTVMGVGRYLRESGRTVRVHPLEPANSPTLRTGHCVGSHRIQGISDEFVPAILELDEIDEIVDIWDGDAILMAQNLCQNMGLAVGISSGANFLGAIKLVDELGPESTVVTIFPDSNKKYLSTDLCRTEPIRGEYMTPSVELERFTAVR